MERHTTRLPVVELPLGARLAAAHWNSLWLEGDPSALAPPLVALVGTRDADPYGAALARRLGAELAAAGVGVLSGGALGIDAAAHQGAVDVSGRSVVVLPSGLEHWYPRRHEGLYRRVLAAGGALVSQFPPETPPARWTFPRRNELLAAMADVVVVVQAGATSGALFTADAARRLGRRLMAVPASPGDRRGAGCLRLLRAGAQACTQPGDVLELLRAPPGELELGRAPARARAPRAPREAPRERPVTTTSPGFDPGPLDDDGRLVYDSLASTPRHVDELARLTGLPTSRIQHTLLTLMLSGLCEDRGGGMYLRARA